MTQPWTNWSGEVRCEPRRIAKPSSRADFGGLLQDAARADDTVRVAGSGHSFAPLCATDGLLVTLDQWTGIESVDDGAGVASIRAGTTIHDMGDPLRTAGWALENQGDVDVQTLAGAIATGTHGTGKDLGSLSTQVAALEVVLANGESVEWSADRDPRLFKAAQLSLGALGIVVAVQLRVVPAYRLQERLWRVPIEECLDGLAAHIEAHRHFEFFWYPQTDLAHMKALDPTDSAPDELPGVEGERIDHSARIFPSVREVRFNEMEYAIPAEAGPACLREIRGLMQEQHGDVTWPVEYRTVAQDDLPLSPAYGRPTVTLSIHQDAQLPFERFFRDAESILRRYSGRPHWGKIHWLTARELQDLYPEWNAFQSARDQLDPHGRFLNPHLRKLLITDK